MSYAIIHTVYGLIIDDQFFERLNELSVEGIARDDASKKYLVDHINSSIDEIDIEEVDSHLRDEDNSPFSVICSDVVNNTQFVGVILSSLEEGEPEPGSRLDFIPSEENVLQANKARLDLPQFIQDLLRDRYLEVHLVWGST